MLASSHSLHQDLNEELDEVFKARQKQGSYKSIPKEKRMILKREFDRNPFPKTTELKLLATLNGITFEKINAWFVYQRKVDYKNKQKFVKSMKKKFCFDKNSKSILENAYRTHSKIDSVFLEKLAEQTKAPLFMVKRWFYYRNHKLRKILRKKKLAQNQTKPLQEIENTSISPVTPNTTATPIQNFPNHQNDLNPDMSHQYFFSNNIHPTTFLNQFILHASMKFTFGTNFQYCPSSPFLGGNYSLPRNCYY